MTTHPSILAGIKARSLLTYACVCVCCPRRADSGWGACPSLRKRVREGIPAAAVLFPVLLPFSDPDSSGRGGLWGWGEGPRAGVVRSSRERCREGAFLGLQPEAAVSGTQRPGGTQFFSVPLRTGLCYVTPLLGTS